MGRPKKPTADDIARADRLRGLREARWLTPSELAIRSGIDLSEISRLESGISKFTSPKIQQKLAAVYECSVGDLVNYAAGNGDMPLGSLESMRDSLHRKARDVAFISGAGEPALEAPADDHSLAVGLSLKRLAEAARTPDGSLLEAIETADLLGVRFDMDLIVAVRLIAGTAAGRLPARAWIAALHEAAARRLVMQGSRLKLRMRSQARE